MSELFLDILNRSISTSWVVLAVILVRSLLKKAPRSYTCFLWWIVGFRLYMSSLPKTGFSLVPSAQTIAPESLLDQEPVISSGVPIIDNVVNPIYTESFRANELASVNPLQVWIAIAANIWLLVMIVIWLWAFLSWLRVRRRVAASVKLRDNIYLCDAIDTPFILGALNPKIYLPSTLTAEQQRHVIAHERSHIRRRDYYYKPLAYFLLSVNWFNPLLWVAYILLCRDIELACDELVIRDMTAEDKKGYSSALLDCSIHRHMIAACPLAFGEVGVKERIKAVLSYKKPTFWLVLIATIAVAAVTVCFITDPVAKDPVLRYNATLYGLVSRDTSFLPQENSSVGTLRSILHDTTEPPLEDLQATNLDESLAGCPLYQEEDRIYLQKMDGSCMLFRAYDPENTVQDFANSFRSFAWTVYNGSVEMTGETQLGSIISEPYAELIASLKGTRYTPGPASGEAILELTADSGSEHRNGISLCLYNSGQWELTVHREVFAGSRYTFTSQALDSWAAPILDRSGHFASVFGERRIQIHAYALVEQDNVMRFGLPDGWEFELLDADSYDGIVGFSCHPSGQSGEIRMCYYPDGESIPLTGGIPVGTQSSVTYPTGLTGTRIIPDGSETWSMIVFETQIGTLFATAENADGWQEDVWAAAEAILGSITMEAGGLNVIPPTNRLGIRLSVENPTPNGLTLVTTQDGSPWNAIFTGSNYNVARWYEEKGEWALLPQREGTAWTMVAYSVPLNETTRTGINWEWAYGTLEPGTYRIYKTYTGERGFLADREEIEETCYAEFVIE